MSLIDKGDLKHDYSWPSEKPGSNPKDQDSNLFDRENGKEVLHIINEYAEEENITEKEKALEIERKLHNNLSQDVTTQRGVFEWLRSNFKSKSNDS